MVCVGWFMYVRQHAFGCVVILDTYMHACVCAGRGNDFAEKEGHSKRQQLSQAGQFNERMCDEDSVGNGYSEG